ncbi:MAG: transposase [Rubrivivax sp.]|nr:transposase [Rubrivivax sp.]
MASSITPPALQSAPASRSAWFPSPRCLPPISAANGSETSGAGETSDIGAIVSAYSTSQPFVDVGAPAADELHVLLQTLITRLMERLTHGGVLLEGMGPTYLAEPDADGKEAHAVRTLQAAAVAYRIAFGRRHGKTVLTLRGANPRNLAAGQSLRADTANFGLHAAVRAEAHDRKQLEQQYRHISRPALSDERVSSTAPDRCSCSSRRPDAMASRSRS